MADAERNVGEARQLPSQIDELNTLPIGVSGSAGSGIVLSVLVPSLLAVLLVGILATLIMTEVHRRENLQQERVEVDQRIEGYSFLINSIVAVGDFSTMEKAAPIIMRDANVVSLHVQSQYGHTIVKHDETPLDTAKTTITHSITQPSNPAIELGKVTWGVVYLNAGLMQVDTISIVVWVVALILIAVVIYLLLTFRIIAPLSRMEQEIYSTVSKNWQLRLPGSPREINTLNETLRAQSQRILRRNEALIQSNTNLQEQIEEKERVQNSLAHAQKMEALGTLVGEMAHDLNNMLSVVAGSIELTKLENRDLPDKPKKRLNEALSATRRAAEFISQLMAFSRKEKVHRQTMDVGALIPTMKAFFDRTINTRVQLNIDVPANQLYCHIDQSQLGRALINLVKNASDAMPRGGVIDVRAQEFRNKAELELNTGTLLPGKFVKISIQDTGSGMEESVVKQMFEAFYTTKEKGQGTGLGMAMVASFAQETGGQIGVETTLGEGSTISIYIPKVPLPKRITEYSEMSDTAINTEIVNYRRQVLLIEDNVALRTILEGILQDYGCDTASEDDLDRVLENPSELADYDLILSDIDLPGKKSVFDLLKAIQSLKNEPGVALMTGSVNEDRLEEIRKVKDVPILKKPIFSNQLFRLILGIGY